MSKGADPKRQVAVLVAVTWSVAAAAGPFPSTPSWVELPSCRWRAVEIAMTGDVMQHGEQLAAARLPDGSYSYAGQLAAVSPWIASADLAIANLEVPLGGGAYHGFPKFNAPDALADELAAAGFDLLTTANNHSADAGRDGLIRTLEQLDARKLRHAGTRASPDAPTAAFVDLDGLVVGVDAWTWATKDAVDAAPGLVNFLEDEEHVVAGIRAMRERADLVIAAFHWGDEYVAQPSARQRALARVAVEAGADVVLGTHPHVLQPAEVWTVGGRDALVLFSLGNFLSNQRQSGRDGGTLARLTVMRCDELDQTWLADVRHTPVWVHDDPFRVLPAWECALDAADCASMAAFRTGAARVLGVREDPAVGAPAWAAALGRLGAPCSRERVPGYGPGRGPIR